MREQTNEKVYTFDWKCMDRNKIFENELYYKGVQVKTLEYGTLPVLNSGVWPWYVDETMIYVSDCYKRVKSPMAVTKPSETDEFPWGVPYKVLVQVQVPIIQEPVIKTVYVRSPPVEVVKMPRHLVRLVLEAAVSKGDACPITMEPFTKDSVVMTPCGHLFEREAIQRSLAGKEECPNCRSAVHMEELQGY